MNKFKKRLSVPLRESDKGVMVVGVDDKMRMYVEKSPTLFSTPSDYHFTKLFDIADDFLMNNFSSTEYLVVRCFIRMSIPHNNSLQPFNDLTTVSDIERSLSLLFDDKMGISRFTIKNAIEKMRVYGVIATPKVVEGVDYTYFWLLNPLVSMKKSSLPMGIRNLFDGYPITNYCYNKHKESKYKKYTFK